MEWTHDTSVSRVCRGDIAISQVIPYIIIARNLHACQARHIITFQLAKSKLCPTVQNFIVLMLPSLCSLQWSLGLLFSIASHCSTLSHDVT